MRAPKPAVNALRWIAAACCASIAAADTTVYTTDGFEPPHFVIGTLTGQRQWAADPPSSGIAAQVQNSGVFEGAAAARFSAMGLSLGTWWYPAVNHTIGAEETLVTVEADLRLSTTGTPSGAWGIDVFDPGLRRIAYAYYSSATGTLWLHDEDQQQAVNTGVAMARGQWRRWALEMNFSTGLWTLRLDGARVGQPVAFGTIGPPITAVGDADIRVSAPASDALEVDNYRITAIRPVTPCAGDANGDRIVNSADLSVLLFRFGGPANGPQQGDFNEDGVCNSADLSVLLFRFGSVCD